ncbi:MAG: hypothetical protein AB7T86_11820 [Xanthobacteraceae bacterium]|uniref:hypothetical protein n=1 Tax=Pseudolabrys sp. TaxID=1960880 RepID=UPI003D12D2C4
MPKTANATAQAYPRLRTALDALADWVRRSDDACAAEREFAQLPPQELSVIAQDLGVSVHDLRAVSAKGADGSAQLLKRMEILRLDPAEIAYRHPAVMQDLERVCALCDSRRHCRSDLRRDPANTIWESYCPNADTLRGLRAKPQT